MFKLHIDVADHSNPLLTFPLFVVFEIVEATMWIRKRQEIVLRLSILYKQVLLRDYDSMEQWK
jgi:hypothetical protein